MPFDLEEYANTLAEKAIETEVRQTNNRAAIAVLKQEIETMLPYERRQYIAEVERRGLGGFLNKLLG